MGLEVRRQFGAIAGTFSNLGLLMLTLTRLVGTRLQMLAVAKELGLDISKLNVNGGVNYGISFACVGGGQGVALLLQSLKMSNRSKMQF